MGLATYHYFTGEALTLPLRLIAHLQPVPLTLEQVPVGRATLPLQANGYITTLTHDLAGPFTRPDAAALYMGLLGIVLAGWLAVVSRLPRTSFLVGMALAIFFLMSLSMDLLGVFAVTKQYFLLLTLLLLAGTAYGLHAFGARVSLPRRGLIFGALVAGLGALLVGRSQLPPDETVLHLTAYATPAGATLAALLIVWLGFENIHGLLWLNTQAAEPSGRFGLGPLLAASGLYLGTLALYFANDGDLPLYPGVHFDPLTVLLPAALAGALGLARRARTLPSVLPYSPGLQQLFPLVLTGAAGALGYALATANGPLLRAAREFTNLTFLGLGAAFLLYLLLNFAPLIRQRLPVYRVVFEPRRFPYYAMYTLGLLGIGLVLARNQFKPLDYVRAGFYNELGDLARQQSEARPAELAQALLAERYYAESDVLDLHNHRASLGRAALYRFRGQPRNELLALSRALRRAPSEKISLHLAALYADPQDFFSAQQALRQGLQENPRSAALASDLAQLYTRSALTDSVAFYLDLAEQLAPGSYPGRTNQLGFLISQGLLTEAGKRTERSADEKEPAFASNLALLQLLQQRRVALSWPQVVQPRALDDAQFAQLYHATVGTLQPGQPRPAGQDASLARLAELPANAAYTEQLTFLRALLLHATQQEVAARQLLSPLTAGTSPTAGYYQYVLGLWQLKQEQYATAAAQLAQATDHGAAQAPLAFACALAFSGQRDSAAAVARRLLREPAAAAQTNRSLVAALASGELVRPASPLAGFLRSGPAADPARLAQLAAGTAGPVPLGTREISQGYLAAQNKNPAAARRAFDQALRAAPFNETATLAAADFYTSQRDFPAAYEALRRGLEENPESIAMQQAYVLAAVRSGLPDYATSIMEQLRTRLSPAAYATLQRGFAAELAARAAAPGQF